MPIGWNHPIQKKLRQNNKLGDVGIEKVNFLGTCFRGSVKIHRDLMRAEAKRIVATKLFGFVALRATLPVLECRTD